MKFVSVFFWACFFYPQFLIAQNKQFKKIKLGAYYFDGWTGKTNHITQKLQDSFAERKPIWGWKTSTPQIMRKQIDLAANFGLVFFDFCWYYSGLSKINKEEPLNHALQLFLSEKNHKRLKFCILVVNHHGYTVGPNEWDHLIKLWLPLLKNPSYLRANSKPFISFFDVGSLVKEFGSAHNLRAAFDKLRDSARLQGIGEIAIGGCINSSVQDISQAEYIGIDIITGYSFHNAGFSADNNEVKPIDSLIIKEPLVWDKYLQSRLPFIPVTSLNFDPTPWGSIVLNYKTSSRYIGFSSSSVYKSISSIKKWILKNSTHITLERLALVYAWNENGEGAWLTPSKKDKLKLLTAVSKAVKIK